MEDGVTFEAPAVQPEVVVQPEAVVQSEVVIQPEVAAPIATMMERPRRQQRQPVHLQNCEVNLDDEVDDNGDLVHFAFLTDSEHVRLADVIQHPKWQKAMNEELMAIEKNNIMTQIGFNLDIPIKIYVDNVSVINLAKNLFFHQRSKHIDIRYHFLRDQVGKNMIKLEYSEDHIADIFTKSLKINVFIKLRDLLSMKVVPNPN